MRVCVVSLNRFVHDVAARVLVRSLVGAGHGVVVVAGGRGPNTVVDGAEVRYVPSRYPVGGGALKPLLRRLQPQWLRKVVFSRALAAAAAATGASIFHPTSDRAVPIAVRAARGGGAVARDPAWQSAGFSDLIKLAPYRSEAGQPAPGSGSSSSTPASTETGAALRPGRFAGRRLALCYRKTDTNPGRYLEAALLRAGVALEVYTDQVPWARLPSDLDGVVFVESPYPALEISGVNPGLPVAYWVHHGEHRLMTNIRLCERYGADAVLLAHSWHLAHRFPVPVHRFPFAVAPELHAASPTPFADRRFDVGFVGAGIDDGSAAYAGRRSMLAALENALGSDRVAFRNGISARHMAETYYQARIVVDEGGTLHFPITMRVFEAIGSGALLLSVPAPGVDMLLSAGEHFVALEGDPVDQVRSLLHSPLSTAAIAAAGHRLAARRHTYDNRVDDLLAILATIDPRSPVSPADPPPGLAGLVSEDVDIQRLAAFGLSDMASELPLHEVWDGDEIVDRLHPASIDAVAIGPDGSHHLEAAIRAAHRFVYAVGPASSVERAVSSLRPGSTITRVGHLLRIDVEGRWPSETRATSPPA